MVFLEAWIGKTAPVLLIVWLQRQFFTLSLCCLLWCKPNIVYWRKKRHQNHSEHHVIVNFPGIVTSLNMRPTPKTIQQIETNQIGHFAGQVCFDIFLPFAAPGTSGASSSAETGEDAGGVPFLQSLEWWDHVFGYGIHWNSKAETLKMNPIIYIYDIYLRIKNMCIQFFSIHIHI